jgi:hypothetical protein
MLWGFADDFFAVEAAGDDEFLVAVGDMPARSVRLMMAAPSAIGYSFCVTGRFWRMTGSWAWARSAM